jgi:hypothetical protein
MEGGYFQIFLTHWTYHFPNQALDNYRVYLSMINKAGGNLAIRMHGPTTDMIPNKGALPWNWQAYAPTNILTDEKVQEDWRTLIYNQLKYIIVKDERVKDYRLFQDNEFHETLGLGAENILFSHYYSYYGPDPFQFRGTWDEAFIMWRLTYEASKRVEKDYKVDIKLGGFGFDGAGSEYHTLPGYPPRSGYDGFIHSLIKYSADPNGDKDDSDRIAIDWIDYQFRHSDPFAISRNNNWNGNPRRQLLTFLADAGYTDVPVMANEWHSQARVSGERTARNELMTYRLEDQTEIDAAYVPAAIFDMEQAGQTIQWRESIQDYGVSDDYPLFKLSGSFGVFTIGTRENGLHGLRKANFNAFVMLGRLGDIRLYSKSDGISFFNNAGTINCIATKTKETGNIQVLIWTYISPHRYVGIRDPTNKVRYGELYNRLTIDMGGGLIGVNLQIKGLQGKYELDQYLIDQTHSNAWYYRDKICLALGHDLCRERGEIGNFSVGEVNQWIPDNNPYKASVALEKIKSETISVSGQYQIKTELLPYSVLLLEFSREE